MDLYSHCGRLLGIGDEWKVTDVKLDMAHLKVDLIGGVNGLKPVLPENYNHKPN